MDIIICVSGHVETATIGEVISTHQRTDIYMVGEHWWVRLFHQIVDAYVSVSINKMPSQSRRHRELI